MITYLLSLFLVSGVLVDGSFPVKKLAKRGLYHPQQHGSTYARGFTSVVHGYNGHNYGGNDHSFDFGQGQVQGHGHGGYVHRGGIVFGGHSNGLSLNQGNGYGHGYGYGNGHGYGNSVPHNIVNHVVKVPVPVAEPVPVIRNVPVSVPHYVPVEVRRPVKVPVPHPVPVVVEKPYPVPVDRPVPVYVPSPVKVPHPVPQPYPVPPPVNPHQEHSHHFTLPLPSKPISTIPSNSYIPINQPAHVGGTSLEHSGLDLSFQHSSKFTTSYGAPSVSYKIQNTEFISDSHSSNSLDDGTSSSSHSNDGYSYPIPSIKFSH
ncbi:hypothetical protein M0804_009801 [Polistes exclamans]|nr:hypothetical protein M0804_009801 [Polistes exclamans]